jgi:hypothetical protein
LAIAYALTLSVLIRLFVWPAAIEPCLCKVGPGHFEEGQTV